MSKTKIDKRKLNKLQRKTLNYYGNCKCTCCGNNPVVTKQLNEYYKGIKVRIMLCDSCVPIFIKRLIDESCEGHVRENLIDNLTQFGQI